MIETPSRVLAIIGGTLCEVLPALGRIEPVVAVVDPISLSEAELHLLGAGLTPRREVSHDEIIGMFGAEVRQRQRVDEPRDLVTNPNRHERRKDAAQRRRFHQKKGPL